MKKCSKCKTEKAKAEFSKKSRNKDGLQTNCKSCNKAYFSTPENTLRRAAYAALPEVKLRKAPYNTAYRKLPERKRKKAIYDAIYQSRPEVRARKALQRKLRKHTMKQPTPPITEVAIGDAKEVSEELWRNLRRDLRGALSAKLFEDAYSQDFSKSVFQPETIAMIRRTVPQLLAKDIIDVDPMSGNLFADLLAKAVDEDTLREEGFEPVSEIGLMWIKETDMEDGLE